MALDEIAYGFGTFTFQDQKFQSASEALEAYINQSAGKKWKRKLKYERELLALLCTGKNADPDGYVRKGSNRKVEELIQLACQQLQQLNFYQSDPYSSSSKLTARLTEEKSRPDKKVESPVKLITEPERDNEQYTNMHDTKVPALSDKLLKPSHLEDVEKLLDSIKQSYAKLTSGTEVDQNKSAVGDRSTVPQSSSEVCSSQNKFVSGNSALPFPYGTAPLSPAAPIPGSYTPSQLPATPLANAYTPALSAIGSDAAASSIVSGHLQKPVRNYQEQDKMASTPKAMGRVISTGEAGQTINPPGHDYLPQFGGYSQYYNPSQGQVDQYMGGIPTTRIVDRQVPMLHHAGYQNFSSEPVFMHRPPALYNPGLAPNTQELAPTLNGQLYGTVGRSYETGSAEMYDENGREQRYEEFLQNLMKDIEEGHAHKSLDNSSEIFGLQAEHLAQVEPQDNEFGFLERVKNMLSTEPPAASDSCSTPGSASVRAILEGKKPWDNWGQVAGSMLKDHSKPVTQSDKFIAECLAEAEADKKADGSSAYLSEHQLQQRLSSFNPDHVSAGNRSDQSSRLSSLSLNESVAGLLSDDVKKLLSKSGRQETGGDQLARVEQRLAASAEPEPKKLALSCP